VFPSGQKITSIFFFVMMTGCSNMKTLGWHYLKWHVYVIAARTRQVITMRRSTLCFALAAVPAAAFLPAAPRSTPSLRVCGGIQMVADTQESRRKVLGTAAAFAGERKKRNADLHREHRRNATLMLALYRDSILSLVLSDDYVFEQLGFSPMASRLRCQPHLLRCRPFPTTIHPLSLRLMKVLCESLL